jgi:hypothetical protein
MGRRFLLDGRERETDHRIEGRRILELGDGTRRARYRLAGDNAVQRDPHSNSLLEARARHPTAKTRTRRG